MAVTFSGACSVVAPVICAADAKLPTGGWSTGIGFIGADGTALAGATAIGGAAVVLKVDTDGNAATPSEIIRSILILTLSGQ